LVRRLGESARRKAVSDFDEKIVITRTLEVYDELLGHREWRIAGESEKREVAREAA
jgi:hypothetical protein